MNFSRTVALGLGLAAAVMLLGLRPASADVTVDAGYFGDSPSYVFHNNGPGDLTNIQFTGSGGGYASDTQILADILAGTSFTVYGGGPIGRNVYANDPDDFGTGKDYTLSVSALLGGSPVSATFSPGTNLTGSYVDFEGNVGDADFTPVHVATLGASVVSPAPEPAQTASLVFIGLGLAGVVVLGRKKKALNLA